MDTETWDKDFLVSWQIFYEERDYLLHELQNLYIIYSRNQENMLDNECEKCQTVVEGGEWNLRQERQFIDMVNPEIQD